MPEQTVVISCGGIRKEEPTHLKKITLNSQDRIGKIESAQGTNPCRGCCEANFKNPIPSTCGTKGC